jgi:hypothetical protein
MRVFWLWWLLGACGSPSPSPSATGDAPRSDAPAIDATADTAIDGPTPPDLSCLGESWPTDAPDPLDVTGKVFAIDHYQVAADVGAIVTVHRRVDDTIIATAPPTGSDGAYSISISSGGSALDAYDTVAADGQLPARIDPGDPITTGLFALAITATTGEVQRWYADAGASYDATASTLIAIVVDCKHATVADATVTVTPTAHVTYYNPAIPQWDPSASSSANGFALVTGGGVDETITAAWQGHAFPARVAVAPIGAVSLAVVSPFAPSAR